MTPGLVRHFLLTLQLNFRSRQAIVYGYLVPVFFLLAFGSVFRAGNPVLLGQMGQLVTITILGGACFGLPTGLVAERERGVWRRYRLVPVPLGALLLSTLFVRLVIVALAVTLQIFLARAIYGTPLPMHSLQFAAAFFVVSFAFLGLGLVIAALAHDVPAVQALGQCLFLPMIMIGGVGVPLIALPDWAQKLASFMPGRYAVELLQPCFSNPHGLRESGFSAAALLVIGGAAAIAGTRLFRWDSGRRLGTGAQVWVVTAFAGWLGVGAVALALERTAPVTSTGLETFDEITEAQITAISYENLPDDDGIYTPLAAPFVEGERLPPRIAELTPRLEAWPPGKLDDVGQSVRNLLSVAAIADIMQDRSERWIARKIYDHLRSRYDDATLSRALAWIILDPDAGTVVTSAPELALVGEPDPGIIRERSGWYARKFLGRIRGSISEPHSPAVE